VSSFLLLYHPQLCSTLLVFRCGKFLSWSFFSFLSYSLKSLSMWWCFSVWFCFQVINSKFQKDKARMIKCGSSRNSLMKSQAGGNRMYQNRYFTGPITCLNGSRYSHLDLVTWRNGWKLKEFEPRLITQVKPTHWRRRELKRKKMSRRDTNRLTQGNWWNKGWEGKEKNKRIKKVELRKRVSEWSDWYWF
jgi:hypothetical protein